MPNPWDPLPLPLFGDQDDSTLYEALGRAVDGWENIEMSLSLIYSLFSNDRSLKTMRQYGANGNIFRERLDGIARVANTWFTRSCNQEMEGEFNRLVVAARGFSERRNEFAHGVVMDVSGFIFWRLQMTLHKPEKPRFIVMPQLYVIKKHDVFGMPTFGYASYELSLLSERMTELDLDFALFMDKLWPSLDLPREVLEGHLRP